MHASKQARKQAGTQVGRQASASKHLEGIQSEPCPVGVYEQSFATNSELDNAEDSLNTFSLERFISSLNMNW